MANYRVAVVGCGGISREEALFPLKSVEIDGSGKETSRMVVTKIEKKSLDGSLFAIPADYKRVDLPKLPGR